MQLYFSPEIISPEHQVLNVCDQNDTAVGYLTFLFEEKKIYVYGQLENEGSSDDFKDLVTPYIKGVAKSVPDCEIYSSLAIGGKKLQLAESEDSE